MLARITILIAGCAPPPAPTPAPSLALDAERTWGDEGGLDQHHATVAVLPADRPPPAGVAAAYAAWNSGELSQPHTVIRAPLDRRGAPLEPRAVVDDAAKPDVESAPDGAVLMALETSSGVELHRLAPDGDELRVLVAPSELAAGLNSVDLAVRPEGGALVVWYESTPPLARYRAAGVDPTLLARDNRLPEVLAETDDAGNSTPDVHVDPLGAALVALVDQHLDPSVPDSLRLQRYADDGALTWEITLAEAGNPGDEPRRPTVTADGSGRIAVAWRERGQALPSPSAVRLAFVDPDGGWLAPPFDPLPQRAGDADDIVAAMVGDDHVWIVWTAIRDPELGLGEIMGELVAFPGGEIVAGPVRLSAAATASRPHTNTAPWGDRVGVAVSWEQLGDDGVRVVRGRVGTIGVAGE